MLTDYALTHHTALNVLIWCLQTMPSMFWLDAYRLYILHCPYTYYTALNVLIWCLQTMHLHIITLPSMFSSDAYRLYPYTYYTALNVLIWCLQTMPLHITLPQCSHLMPTDYALTHYTAAMFSSDAYRLYPYRKLHITLPSKYTLPCRVHIVLTHSLFFTHSFTLTDTLSRSHTHSFFLSPSHSFSHSIIHHNHCFLPHRNVSLKIK